MDQNDIYMNQGNRPVWQSLIAAFMFTIMIVFLYKFFYYFELLSAHPRGVINYMRLAIFAFVAGTAFSMVKDYHFDFKNKRYRIVSRIGLFKFGKWKYFKTLEYISVYKTQRNIYQVNLWYDGTKHFNISFWDSEDGAIKEGQQIAKKLEIKLLDATDPYNSKWVDIQKP